MTAAIPQLATFGAAPAAPGMRRGPAATDEGTPAAPFAAALERSIQTLEPAPADEGEAAADTAHPKAPHRRRQAQAPGDPVALLAGTLPAAPRALAGPHIVCLSPFDAAAATCLPQSILAHGDLDEAPPSTRGTQHAVRPFTASPGTAMGLPLRPGVALPARSDPLGPPDDGRLPAATATLDIADPAATRELRDAAHAALHHRALDRAMERPVDAGSDAAPRVPPESPQPRLADAGALATGALTPVADGATERAGPSLAAAAGAQLRGVGAKNQDPATAAATALAALEATAPENAAPLREEKSSAGAALDPATVPTPVPGLGSPPAGPAALPTMAPPPQLSATVGSPEWVPQLAGQLAPLGPSRREVELNLNPLELGPLKVTLSLKDAQTQIVFVSEHPAVRQALEAALPQLRATLADNGISLGQTSVGSGSGEPRPESGPTRDFAPRRDQPREAPPVQRQPEAALRPDPVAARASRTGVDTFA